ncbi:hypothetical protein EON65_27310, partial [archaeon]
MHYFLPYRTPPSQVLSYMWVLQTPFSTTFPHIEHLLGSVRETSRNVRESAVDGFEDCVGMLSCVGVLKAMQEMQGM